ncbi:MAG TPA: PHP domain-containing protein [Vicinamibacterales bacterium]|nr:PHP domain-containing protein [Vicinamibacterales bacterium]
MIDLHTHTIESDGRCTPAELVARARASGVDVLAVTDHDTVSGCEATAAACTANGIEFVPGIEITAAHGRRDVHILGYFFDVTSPSLNEFLRTQRQARVDRVRQIVARLADLGIPLDEEELLRPAIDDPRKAAGRPWIARALVAGGYVGSASEAFDRWLGHGKPAFIPRCGASPAEVFTRIHGAGGVAALAHPALVRHDEWIEGFVADGLDALEAYHSEHDAAATSRYLTIAQSMGIAVSGGSDFHGDDSHGPPHPGAVSLPLEAYEQLVRRRNCRL